MTKAQALALMEAIRARGLPASAVLSFPAGAELWGVQLDPGHVYDGSDLGALANYCAAQGLALTARFVALGVV